MSPYSLCCQSIPSPFRLTTSANKMLLIRSSLRFYSYEYGNSLARSRIRSLVSLPVIASSIGSRPNPIAYNGKILPHFQQPGDVIKSLPNYIISVTYLDGLERLDRSFFVHQPDVDSIRTSFSQWGIKVSKVVLLHIQRPLASDSICTNLYSNFITCPVFPETSAHTHLFTRRLLFLCLCCASPKAHA